MSKNEGVLGLESITSLSTGVELACIMHYQAGLLSRPVKSTRIARAARPCG